MRWLFNIVHSLQKVWDEMMMRPKGLASLVLIILFFLFLLAALWFHTLLILGFIVIVIGILFPVFLPQWKSGFSFLLILCGVILLLQEQRWFQGFFQNTAVTILKKQGKDYGEKIEAYNRTMAIMSAESESNRQDMIKLIADTKGQLSAESESNRQEIVKLIADTKEQQQNIRTQGEKLRETEADVRRLLDQTVARQDSITTNITAFNARLVDSQSRVKALMITRKFEHFTLGNTNEMLFAEIGDDAIVCLLRLKSAAIPNNVDFEVPNTSIPPNSCAKIRENIYSLLLENKAYEQVKRFGVKVKYLPDPDVTDLYSWTITSTNTLMINGVQMAPVKRFLFPDTKATAR